MARAAAAWPRSRDDAGVEGEAGRVELGAGGVEQALDDFRVAGAPGEEVGEAREADEELGEGGEDLAGHAAERE